MERLARLARRGSGPLVDCPAGCVPARLLADGGAWIVCACGLEGDYGFGTGMDELADEFDGHRPGSWVGILMEVTQCRFQDECGTGRAGVAFAAVAGQRVEDGDPDLRIGVIGHGDQLVHGFAVDQMVQESTAAFADSRALMLETASDRGHRVVTAL